MKRSLGALAIATLIATSVFYLIAHAMSAMWLDLALRPEVRQAIRQSLDDQRRLRDLDPAGSRIYRKRFERSESLLRRIEIIRLNRAAILRRIELTLMTAFALTFATTGVLWISRQRRAEERKRQEYVDRLKSWQEAGRRHAHEIRTPLTAARMELDRLVSVAEHGDSPERVRQVAESVFEEFDRIAHFTKEFSSFAAIGQPVLQAERLHELLTEFCTLFEDAWPNLNLHVSGSSRVSALCDRDLLRQVLVNLCTNSAGATRERGSVTFRIDQTVDSVLIDVSDQGSGIPESIRKRIFEPYVTTRKIGEGMGLGLAISRKILLDHGGDLQLLHTSPEGTTFRMELRSGR